MPDSTAPTIQDQSTEDPGDVARRIVDLLADRQAEDTVLLDIREVASFADFFVIATAANSRQMKALLETTDAALKEDGVRPLHKEGGADSGWVLADYGSIIVHIFSPDLRDYYALEELWQEATEVVRIQ